MPAINGVVDKRAARTSTGMSLSAAEGLSMRGTGVDLIRLFPLVLSPSKGERERIDTLSTGGYPGGGWRFPP
jgi:hypothetical protein